MRVKILNQDPETLPKPIYWRGIALDEFDGRVWRASDFNHKSYTKNQDGIIQVKETMNETLFQEIITEPLDTNILFSASFPVGFGKTVEGKIEEVNDSYMLPSRVSYRLKYLSYSDLSVPSPEELRSEMEVYPVSIKKRYLQLPPLSGRIKELAREITSSDRNAYDKAISIKRYLIDSMNYTITLPKGIAEFPLEDFLFKTEAGHCEYFATAMVILLREIGIPARVVNGFLSGEWNEYGKFFLVRQSHAHSWVEVFFPEHGWVLFDPTPASGEGFLTKNSIASYLDYLRYRWSRYVVDFSQRDQIRLLSEVQDKWKWQKSKFQNRVDFNLRLDKKWVFAIVLLALGMWILSAKTGIKSLFSYQRKRPDERASIAYKKALILLSKKGFGKEDFITPREFAKCVIRRGGKRFQTFHELTERYLGLRFGENNIESGFKELDKLLDKLKKEIK
jgi:transglutaminase-like putative cysteine protease